MLITILVMVVAGAGASPAARTYVGVEQAIANARTALKQQGAASAATAEGWNAYFDVITKHLQAYATSKSEKDCVAALGDLHHTWSGLAHVGWQPAADVREELAAWLRPRVMLAWANNELRQSVRSLPPTADPQEQNHRDRWIEFVDRDLATAVREFESSAGVSGKTTALGKLRKALGSVDSSQKAHPWAPAQSLQSALNDLFNQRNLHATADLPSLQPRLAHEVVESGPVYRRGNVSQVTAGAYRGFGLLSSDDGIAFYNKQLFSSVTPVNNFQGQIASDPRGKRVAKMYYFGATTFDSGEVTATAVLRPSGLFLYSDSTHNTDARIGSAPTSDHNFGRMIAGLIGMNQQRITNKVYEGAIGRIRSEVRTEARAEADERLAKAQVQENDRLRPNLPGDGTLLIRNLLVTDLSLRSRPDRALIDGTLEWRGATEQVGAESTVPRSYQMPVAGVAADVHLPSVLTNFSRGYLQSPDVKSVENLMIVTRKIPPDAPPQEGIELSRNVSWDTFSKAVDTARAANDPKVMAIRVKRPDRSPVFSADKNGYLIALVHDFAIEVPVPEQARTIGGAPARIYRLEAQEAEVAISFKIAPPSGKVPIKLSGRIEAFDPGPNAKVFAITDDEAKAAELNRLAAALVFAGFGTKLRGQPIDVSLSQIELPNFELGSVTPLDPTGWIRFVLTPKPQ
jgi:hypothetical protein